MSPRVRSGAPVLVVEHGAEAPLGRLDPLGADVDVRRAWAGEALPADLAGCSALVVLGGAMAAWEDDVAPWLPATRHLLALAVAEGVPVLGVCLGAQLLALATGGRVERGERGLEAGLLDVTATADADDDALVGPLARAPGRRWLAAQAHGDAVTRLPDDAVLLAGSAAYPVQAFRVGRAAWGVQYHPEATRASLATWFDESGPALAARGTSAEQELRRVDEHEQHLAALAEHHRRHLVEAAAGSSR